ncbi:MAG: hypothetical protein AABX37_02195 [Nanoarchaeota archaeon]
MIELYDVGRTTHKPVPKMYEFIMQNADRYVQDQALAQRLKDEAAQRELPGHSIPQELFSEMCRIWVEAHRTGDFPIEASKLVYPDTIPQFRRVKEAGRNIGVLTSGSEEFTKVLFRLPIGEGETLADLVDEFLLGDKIGDKDSPETFARLWDARKSDIYSIYDDKESVCLAASEGIRQAGGYAAIFLVDRNGRYVNQDGRYYVSEENSASHKVLKENLIHIIKSFDVLEDNDDEVPYHHDAEPRIVRPKLEMDHDL